MKKNYIVGLESRGFMIDCEKVVVEFDGERELISKLLLEMNGSERDVIENYYLNEDGGMSFDDIVDDVIEGRCEVSGMYNLNEELIVMSEYEYEKLKRENEGMLVG